MKFAAIRSKGFLISSEMLGKIGTGQFQGQSYQDFGYHDQIAFEQGVSKAWLTMVSCWQDFVSGLQSSGVSQSEDYPPVERWSSRILHTLGFERISEPSVNLSTRQSCPVSHWAGAGEEILPLHFVGPTQGLDEVSKRGGRTLSPHRVLQGYLNRTEHQWGIVTNGFQLRILRKSPRITTDSFLEFDLGQIIDSFLLTEFEIFYRVAHRTRWPTGTEESTPCWLENFREKTLHEHPVSSRLIAGRICDATEAFWHAFQKHPDFESV